MTTQQLSGLANTIRKDLLRAIYNAGSGHPGGSLSAIDILTVLYFDTMHIDPENPKDPDRDRFILSKGHAAPGLYTVQAHRGYFPLEDVSGIRQAKGYLGATTNPKNPGSDATSGSLGQGLSVGVGMALAGRLDKKDYHVFVMVGDGELQEGQNWEAALMAGAYKLDNLCCIVDNNGIQMCGDTANMLPVEDIAAKFEAFGWETLRIEGHNIEEVRTALTNIRARTDGAPVALIANTVKGKGVRFMEDTCSWHGGVINDEQLAQAMADLEEGAI